MTMRLDLSANPGADSIRDHIAELERELDAAKVRETRLLGLIQSTPCTIYEAGHGECRELLTDVLMMCDRCRALVEAGDPHA